MVEEAEHPRKPLPKLTIPLVLEHKERDSYHWTVVRALDMPSPSIDIWWNRGQRKKYEGRTLMSEHLVLRQDSGEEKGNADVIVLSPGQVYDLIDALCRAAEKP